MPPATIRFKMLCVILALAALLSLALLLAGKGLYARYKTLQISQCRALVVEETARVANTIQGLQVNVRELALMGELLLQGGSHRLDSLGPRAVRRNFQINRAAVGGGIWYAPYLADRKRELVCFYAYRKDGSAIVDPSFASQDYHYPRQRWYRDAAQTLAANGAGVRRETVWSRPYVDAAGTHALMSTVSAGMYGADGVFLGLATVDWRMEDIARHIASIRPTPNSLALFADAAHDVILSLHDPTQLRDITGESPRSLSWFEEDAPPERTLPHNGVRYLSFTRKFDNGMSVTVNVPEDELFHEINQSLRLALLTLLVALLAATVLTWILLNRFISKPVARLCGAAVQVGAGNLDTAFPVSSRDELGTLAQAFAVMTGNLKKHIARIEDITAEKERIATELHIARDIQAAMLPSIFPPFPERHDGNLYALMHPAKEVGGDFYDFFFVDDNRLAVVMADVSDKGVPAALFMAIAKTHLRNSALSHTDPGAALAAANVQLCENNNTGMFVTAFMGVLDLRSGGFRYANAGHTPFYVLKRDAGFRRVPLAPALPLAVMEDTRFPSHSLTLERGASLFLYTDGVTEAANPSGAFWGANGLEEALAACAPRLPHDVSGFIDALMGRLRHFTQGARQSDDITMLALSWTPDRTETDIMPGNAGNGQTPPLIRWERTFPARISFLPDFMASLEEGLAAGSFTERQRGRFAVAAEEVFANIASYAYEEGESDGQVDVSLTLTASPSTLRLRLTDSGRAFNPLESPVPDITLPAGDRPPGGLGIFLAEQGSSELRYARRDGKNVLTLILRADTAEMTDTRAGIAAGTNDTAKESV